MYIYIYVYVRMPPLKNFDHGSYQKLLQSHCSAWSKAKSSSRQLPAFCLFRYAGLHSTHDADWSGMGATFLGPKIQIPRCVCCSVRITETCWVHTKFAVFSVRVPRSWSPPLKNNPNPKQLKPQEQKHVKPSEYATNTT